MVKFECGFLIEMLLIFLPWIFLTCIKYSVAIFENKLFPLQVGPLLGLSFDLTVWEFGGTEL